MPAKSTKSTSNSAVPRHIGYIVDGNRRWAKLNGIGSDVHRRGADIVYDIAKATIRTGTEFATFFVFSTENWQRSPEEVSYLMDLFIEFFGEKIEELKSEDIKVVFLGSRDKLSEKVLAVMDETESSTKNGSRGTVCFCFNYGGHQEVADAVRSALSSGLTPDELTPETISAHIYRPEIPPIDIVVRTGGELRLSNFMLWRISYAEFLFLDQLWPDLTDKDVDLIIAEYNRRSRRFGK